MHWAERLASRLGVSLTDEPGALERLDAPDRVLAMLHGAVMARVDVYGEFVNAFERRKLQALSVDPETFDLRVVRAPGGIPPQLRLFFTLDHLTWSFDADVIDAGPDLVTVRTPRSLSFGEQRHARRRSLPEHAGASARLHGVNGGGVSLGRLLDLSRSGLSLRIDRQAFALQSGQRIRRMDLLVDGDTIPVSRIEVRHVTPIGGSEQVRVGLEVGIARRPIHVREVGFPLPAPSKAPRRRRAAREGAWRPEVDVVRYFNARGERIAAILDTTFGERIDVPVPVVILPPSTGRRKETLSGLALTIAENFRRRNRHVAVLRFDGIRRHGESTNDPAGRTAGMEMIHATMGQAIEDIHATLDYLQTGERFLPSSVTVVSSSSASIEARRAIAEDGGRRIRHWISLAGSPDFHDTLRNICGGLDLLGSWSNGVSLGLVPVLGNLIDLDRFFRDAFARRLVYLRDAMDEIASISTPITWIYGEYDDWVRPERVMNLMSVREGGPREVMRIPTGHQMRTSEEAIEAFKLVTACLWRFLYGRRIRPYGPDPRDLAEVREAEKARLRPPDQPDRREFWRLYLERRDRYLGFDIIRETEAYRDLMEEQLAALDLAPGVALLDAGCGTGNFVDLLLRRAARGEAPMPGAITLTDYVPDAIETARAKLESPAASMGRPGPPLDFRVVDLEVSRLEPVARAMAGERVRWEALADAVEGLPPALVRRLAEKPDALAERVARGEDPAGQARLELAEAYGAEGAEILDDLGRAARFVRRASVPEDLAAPGSVDLRDADAGHGPDASALRWNRLAFGRAGLRMALPFPDGSFDRILSSLVLCYLYRPEATIREFFRMLRPGGVLVISGMKPDADMSRIYMRLIERLRSADDLEIPEGFTREDLLASARTFLNKAAGIIQLEEEGAFEFLPGERLADIMASVGFTEIRVVESFGDPPQATVLRGTRPGS